MTAPHPDADAPEREARLARYQERIRAYEAETGLREGQYVAPPSEHELGFLPLPEPRAEGGVVVFSPPNVRFLRTGHPMYFCDLELLQELPVDGGSPNRYAVRMWETLLALGLAVRLDSSPWYGPVSPAHVRGFSPTDQDHALHHRGEPSLFDEVWFTAEDLQLSRSEVLEATWGRLWHVDPDGNRAHEAAYRAQLAAYARADEARNAHIREREWRERASAAFQAHTGLTPEQYNAGGWGRDCIPIVTPRAGDTPNVSVLAPANIALHALGHPVFFTHPDLTRALPTDGTPERYSVRMRHLFSALGLVDEHGKLRDVLWGLGDRASETHRRNHLRGRVTPLDAVWYTWEHSSLTEREIIERAWAELETLDPEGNAALADAWQEQCDAWHNAEYLQQEADARARVARKKAQRQRAIFLLIDTPLALLQAGEQAAARMAEASADRQYRYDQNLKRQCRETYLRNQRR